MLVRIDVEVAFWGFGIGGFGAWVTKILIPNQVRDRL